MIIYTSKDSFLEIPKGLGNLGGNSGGGSGEDLGPLSGSVVELSAVTESEAVKLADLSASTENLASSVGSMATDLEAVSGSVETLTDTVDSQGDSIADLLLDVDALDGRVSGNTSDIEALSAQTSANTADIAALSSATENVSAQTTANTANIETLSAVTSGLASTVSEMAGKQASIYDWDAFYASEDYSERRAIYSAFTQDFAVGKMVLMKGTTSDGSLIYLHLEKVNTSNPYLATFRYESDGGYTNIGITSSGNESGDYNNQGKLTRNKLAAASASTLANSAYTRADSAYTLASSAYTLADSLTGQSSGPTTYVLNFMSQQELAALYTELAPYRWVENYMAISSGFPAQDYAFYFYAGEETSDGWNDGDRGFVPMQLTAIHPDDYGGACFFTGTVKSRQGNNEILWVRYIVTSTGEVDKSTGVNSWSDPVGYFNINADGSVPQGTDRYSFQGSGVIMIKCGDWNRGWVESLSFTDDYMVLHIKGKVQVDGVEYAGYWKWDEGQGAWSTVSFTAV